MGYKSRYDKGDWVALCDSCGRKFKATKLKRRWDGLMVCPEDWEPRQTQDYVRGRAEKQTPSWTRSEPDNTFIPVSNWIAGIAIAGSAVPGTLPGPGVVPGSSFTL
jgi:hypothetical protein